MKTFSQRLVEYFHDGMKSRSKVQIQDDVVELPVWVVQRMIGKLGADYRRAATDVEFVDMQKAGAELVAKEPSRGDLGSRTARAITEGWEHRRRLERLSPGILSPEGPPVDGELWEGERIPMPVNIILELSSLAYAAGTGDLMWHEDQCTPAETAPMAEELAKAQMQQTSAMRSLLEGAIVGASSDSEGLKLDDGKLELWEFFQTFGLAIEAAARHAQWGISIGGRGWANQRKLPTRRYYSAFLRHILAVINRPDALDEHGREHWDAILWNAMEIVQRRQLARMEGGSPVGFDQLRYKATKRYSEPPTQEFQSPKNPST